MDKKKGQRRDRQAGATEEHGLAVRCHPVGIVQEQSLHWQRHRVLALEGDEHAQPFAQFQPSPVGKRAGSQPVEHDAEVAPPSVGEVAPGGRGQREVLQDLCPQVGERFPPGRQADPLDLGQRIQPEEARVVRVDPAISRKVFDDVVVMAVRDFACMGIDPRTAGKVEDLRVERQCVAHVMAQALPVDGTQGCPAHAEDQAGGQRREVGRRSRQLVRPAAPTR